MSRESLVQRLISFLKKPNALEYDREEPVHNPYDDYQTQAATAEVVDQKATAEKAGAEETPILTGNGRDPSHASRLDALVMRAVQQFNAYQGYVIRYSSDDRMHYCTGRDLQGRYVPHTEADVDRRAIFLALDSGESQLFVHTLGDETPIPVLCGPLWHNDQVIGVLYLDNPARSRLHRGIFDVFCDQAARMVGSGVT